MTLEQFGSIINTLGLIVPLLFSLFIGKAYSRPYFRHWTLSYFWLSVALIILDFLGPSRLFGLSALLVLLPYQGGLWYLLRTSEAIRPDRRLSPVHTWVCGLTLGLGLVACILGQSIVVVLTPPVCFVVWVHLLLAIELWSLPHADQHAARHWLAAFIAATGLWVLAYPFFGATPWAWLGYFVSGGLHLLVGVQMVIYLLQDVAATLATQNEALQQVDRLKTNFISTVSHELRTPVTAIKSAAWLLDSPKVDPGELKGIITQQSDALSRIVSDMLDVSLIESGAMTYYPGPIDLVELVEEAVGSFVHLYDAKGVTLTFEPGLERLPVTADADRIKQVMANLLTNALKFTPEGGRVTVRASAEGGHAVVAVVDSGLGIPEPHRAKVFERFYQVDNSSTRKVGGAGLGLAISKAIVEDGHRGRIWAEDAASGGSTFVFTLPGDAAAERA